MRTSCRKMMSGASFSTKATNALRLSALLSRELSPLQFHVTIFMGARKGVADEDDTVRGAPPASEASEAAADRGRLADSAAASGSAGRFGESAGRGRRAIGLLSRLLLDVAELVSIASSASPAVDDAVLAVEAVDSVLDVRAAAGAAALGTRSK
jgi:hypothetical protein